MLLCFLTLVVAILHVAGAVDPVVQLNYTSYRGVAGSNGVSSWKGMRYAQPPLGDLRFRAPLWPLNNTSTVAEDASKVGNQVLHPHLESC